MIRFPYETKQYIIQFYNRQDKHWVRSCSNPLPTEKPLTRAKALKAVKSAVAMTGLPYRIVSKLTRFVVIYQGRRKP